MHLSINRNIMECKVVTIRTTAGEKRVLIETLWNVKIEIACPTAKRFPCINRNIMECKARYLTEELLLVLRINRNIMECKDVSN